MSMTFEQYINNPNGSGSATNTARELYKTDYTNRLNEIISKAKDNRIEYRIYYDKKNGRYFIHFKIPDETYNKTTYDTVIELYTDDEVLKQGRSLKNHFVRFYSNDAAFVYTWAYVYNSQDMFIKELKGKINKLALTQKPVVRNPNEQMGYCKSIYYAYLLMNKYNLFDTTSFNLKMIDYSVATLNHGVMHSEKKKIELSEIATREKKLKTKTKSDIRKEKTQAINTIKTVKPNISTTKAVKTTKAIKNVGNTKRVKRK